MRTANRRQTNHQQHHQGNEDATIVDTDTTKKAIHLPKFLLPLRTHLLALRHGDKRYIAGLVLVLLIIVGCISVAFFSEVLSDHVESFFSGFNSERNSNSEDTGGVASWSLRPDRERRKIKSKPRYHPEGAKQPLFPRQVTEPETVKKSSRRSFGCLRDECRGLAMEDLTDRKWKMMFKTAKDESKKFKTNLNFKVTFLLTDTTEMAKLKKQNPDIYNLVYSSQVGKSYLTEIDGADAIGGNKGQQLRAKERLTKKSGCTYNSLGIQPASYRLYLKDECEEFREIDDPKMAFLLKPETGSQGKGISVHKSVRAVEKKAKSFFPCHQNKSMNALDRYLVMEYIEQPLLLHKAKFDIRVYMLIGSTDPWMVFYHQGYLRRALVPFSPTSKDRKAHLTNTHLQSTLEYFKLSDHIWTFETFQNYLTQKGVASAHYVDAVLDPYIRKTSNFVFQSARSKLARRKASFHIFGLDFMIDSGFRIHFIEANGYPGYTWSINFDTRGMVTDQFDLVQELHEAPAAFQRMKAGDRYGGFQLVFSEFEEETSGFSYDPCYDYHNNLRGFQVFRKAMKQFSKYSGYSAVKILSKPDDSCKGKACKAQRKAEKRDAMRARASADRQFERMSDEIQGSDYIGGRKDLQVQALSDLAQSSGCKLNSLNVMPPTYRMSIKQECENLAKYRTASSWVAKPVYHAGNRGKNIKSFGHQSEVAQFFEECEDIDMAALAKGVQFDGLPLNAQYIVQKQIAKPMLIKKQGWDLRAYMLIASTQPFLVFYRHGYVRSTRFDVNIREFSLEDNAMTWSDFQFFLSKEKKTGAHFMDNVVESYAKRVMDFVFQAARPHLERKKNSFQLYEFNFMMDDNYGLWYMGSNSVPGFSNTRGFDVRNEMMDDLKNLVLEVNDVPEAFTRMRYGDRYGDFRLVFSEYEEEVINQQYNPCREFTKKKWTLPKTVMERVASIHDYTRRDKSAADREFKKYTKGKWQGCRAKYSGTTCGESESVRKYFTERVKHFSDRQRLSLDEEGIAQMVDQRIFDLRGGNATLAAAGA